MSKGQAADLVRPWAGDSNGKILWVNLTEDYRARPQQVLKAFDGWASHSGG